MAMQSGFIKRIRDIMRMDAGINGDAQRIEQMVWMLFLKEMCIRDRPGRQQHLCERWQSKWLY